MNNENLLFQGELTVSDLTNLIKTTLEEGFYGLQVTGEISNFRPSSTGHWFFTLKDSQCAISAVMFKGNTWKVGFTPTEGDKVTVKGSLDVYGARGTYQIKCETMQLSGSGDILAMLEERKQYYASLAYFAADKKIPLPRTPKRVGVVTSPTGAALQDILQILQRRAPALDVLVLPATVQGENAGKTIAMRIEQANALLLCDVLIVGRGGGSLEDLLPFSEPCVIQAIHDSEIPVISAVGHEIDWALSDYVADMRSPTPSAAAELVSQGFLDNAASVRLLKQNICTAMEHRLHLATQKLSAVKTSSLTRGLSLQLERREYRLANASDGLVTAEHFLIKSNEQRLQLAEGRLQALSPLAILARGYTLVTDKKGNLIRTKEAAKVKDILTVSFVDGKRTVLVQE
ncbi:exodeoxyribonuclease VII, large subunit [Sphaerochaeta pleomorpha str. Grapes]|uniref:Exodeoxyribonuclease 7 large subunit n=1 Tax=Sphaerochaeta pleomorpha (strain ATCC BAA-1885 / DSM 22778 / Grapes) TaxID=158190 RepID=G8QQ34_SPHPG|nr:exodeoxyribonuclease VII large subunit [Sphaerochaeta pleomorpha]AEV28611.1 exodeoxyribonuclease VII, large subunit [Sphaerochaeta pleomorpha str. Grapes]